MQKSELLRELTEICEQKKGEVVIYDLAQSVEAFLHKHNKVPCGSFYDQMLLERNRRDEALLQQQAQRLSHEQRLIRDEVLKRKEILRNEDRWRRESRRSMSEQSPKHRTNSSAELTDQLLDQSGCEQHSNSEDLYFITAGRKIRRGCCLGILSIIQSNNFNHWHSIEFIFFVSRSFAKRMHFIFRHRFRDGSTTLYHRMEYQICSTGVKMYN